MENGHRNSSGSLSPVEYSAALLRECYTPDANATPGSLLRAPGRDARSRSEADGGSRDSRGEWRKASATARLRGALRRLPIALCLVKQPQRLQQHRLRAVSDRAGTF